MSQTITTAADLQKSAIQYQKDLLSLPIIGAEATLAHMTGRSGINGRYIISALDGDLELAPFKRTEGTDGAFNVNARTLETFMGLTVSHFAPDEIYKTIVGDIEHKGEAMKAQDISKAILAYSMGLLGRKLNAAIFKGVRDDAGTTTNALFDGFDTITEKEITAGNISTAKGNLIEIDPLTTDNALEAFQKICDAASEELQDTGAKLYCSRSAYQAYCRDFATTFGANPYNTEYKKTYVVGYEGSIEIVPLLSKKGSKFLHLSPKANMIYGYGGGLVDESLEVARLRPVDLTLIAKMLFGVQFASIAPEALMVAKIK